MHTFQILTIVTVSFFVAIAVATNPGTYEVRFLSNLSVTTFDGYVLHADGYFPIANATTQQFPVLIFPNSWACPQFEYILKALSFAEKGFIALEYETRGWYASGGQIDVAGPLDRRDISSVIDLVVDNAVNWNVNVSAIAMVGISYGAGLSIQAAGFERRLATVVSLSGWANLTQALFTDQTPNKAWVDLLEVTGDLLGHPQANFPTVINDLLTHQNMSVIEAYGADRSAGVNLTFMNERRIPIFVSNNFLDRLFQPNTMIDFWNSLEGPKFMLLNQGMHAEAELAGLVDIPHNYVWQKVTLWLQHFLQGVDNGILQEIPIQMQVEYSGNEYIQLPTWPDDSVIQTVKLMLGNRATQHYGQLSTTLPSQLPGPSDVIYYNELSGVYDGLPIVSDLFNEFVPTTNQLLVYVESGANVFMGKPLANTTRVCGTPKYQLTFLPSSSTWQVYTVLYDVDEFDVGEIISDGYYTHWGDGSIANTTTTISSSLHMLCHDVAQGHRFAVGVVLYNAMFTNPNKEFNIVFFYNLETFVEIPIVV